MRRQLRTLTAIWIVLVMKLFLAALLVYFLVFQPPFGGGYGVAYTLFYVLVFCPLAALFMRPKILRRLEQKKAVNTAL